ncbi:biotin carboxyl carrier protein /biotin carboxylase [Limimonas halophila]|uniref:propionyl-CoA carboxylase n=1 Tax=Limimonas halophila TaxID=1082479 RepID=A0A1G7UPW3_9PROT|nr:acetyl/propionyl/methylcrotonyl-CoA carboxylase subunit alpha [Limimonas halophila]SDG48750.1 biotin carboxyl carrier protein /biotin carboxylase [Limimonas halophila]
MFDKVLIANRGEIACRVMRTCRRFGIATVAVYSDADARQPHVQMADEAVRLGPAPASESYLDIQAVLDACRRTGAQAVHPGYGFLSESQAFAHALTGEGITFVGPPPDAIASMGDKIAARQLAEDAGVSIVPGHTGRIDDFAHAEALANDLGYPVMIKAAAGGGGKGMRVAHGPTELREGLDAARREAGGSFGDDRVFIERYIPDPRHIEIQIIADGHGNVVSLGERECSIQRRHQKVIEEAPSPLLDPETRTRMGEQAKALARQVGYTSAGTVEFVADNQENFYFLEMNTRLQVEHPVTELTTGLDLVEWMLRVAAGERLSFTEDAVPFRGWAMEARVYAEDPVRGFLPSIGRLRHYREPSDAEGVRIDSGVTEGSDISTHYDPMIAKACAWGQRRDQAIDRLRSALDAYYVRGVIHNMPFLQDVFAAERFRAGRLSTRYIDEEYPEGFQGAQPREGTLRTLVLVAALVQRMVAARDAGITGQTRGRGPVVDGDWVVFIDGQQVPVHLTQATEHAWRVALEGGELQVDSEWRPGEPLFHARMSGEHACVQVERRGARWQLTHAGVTREARVLRPRAAELAAIMPEKTSREAGRYLRSPMPGLLTQLHVEPGTAVKAGEPLAVVEAMKMENILRAERDGTVSELYVNTGANLAVDQAILAFE